MSGGAERSEQGEVAAQHSTTSIRNLRTEGNSNTGASVHARP